MVRPLFVTQASKEFILKKIADEKLREESLRKRKKTKKKNNFRIKQEFIDSTKEYTQNTTLHGLRYVGADDLHLVERLFWMAAFISGIMAAAYFITILYARWDESPMMISLSPTATPVNSIPFPAITICNMNGATKKVAEEVVRNGKNDSQSFFEWYMLKDVCRERMNSPVSPLDTMDVEWAQIEKFLVKVSQPCEKMMVFCKLQGKSYTCSDLFSSELTDDGICCTFNQLQKKSIYKNLRHNVYKTNFTYPEPAVEWTPEGGYPEYAPENVYPFRALGTGTPMGMTVVLDAALHDYYCSSTASGGFKMVLHNPIETAKISDFAYYIPTGFETRIEIRPKISSSTTAVFGIPQAKRLCYFIKERDLRFFKTYTQSNCELECQSNFTYAHCKCVPYYLPKDDSIRICGTKDIECVTKVKDFLNHRSDTLVINSTTAKKERVTVQNLLDRCSCFPGCVQLQYNKHMSSSVLQDSFTARPNFLNGRNLSYYKKNFAVVHFYFMENSFTPFEKGEIFGFTDFLSNIGGLLGLFLGFSFMSAAEIIYFISLRLFCKKKATGKTSNKTLPVRWPFLL